MLSTFFQPCDIRLHLLQNVIFVRPPPPAAPAGAAFTPPSSEDELVRGLVEVRVPSDRHIGGLKVRLKGMEMVGILDTSSHIPVGFDERVIMDKTLDIGIRRCQHKPHSHGVHGRSSRAPSRSTSRAPSRAPSQPPSRAPSQPPSRASSPSRRGSGGSDEEPKPDGEARGRTPSRDASLASGLAGALAAAMRGRSSSRTTPISGTPRSVSRASRPPSPRSSIRARVPPGWGGHGINPVPGRQSLSLARRPVEEHAGEDEDPDEARGCSAAAPPMPEDSGALGSRRSSGAGLFSRATSRPRGERPVHKAGLLEDTDATEGDPDEGMFLAKGIHGFEFAFILPSNCAPYERSPYGRVRYQIKATIVGGGRAKSNVDAVREIFPMAVPSAESPSTPLAVLYHDWHDSLGSVLSVACTANSISVGGIFNIDVHSPDSPADLIVYQVRVTLETTVDLHTAKRGRQTTRVRPVRLFEKGLAPQKPSEMESPKIRDTSIRWSGTEDSWSCQGLARIPDDNTTRPTTLAGSKADIRFSHQLVVEVIHSRDAVAEGHPPGTERKLKVYALRQPVIIPSCCVAYNAVTLPLYEERESSPGTHGNMYRVPEALSTPMGEMPTQSPWSVAAAPLQAAGHDHCVCGMSIADLEAKERNMLPQVEGYNVPVNEVRPHGKIGDYASADQGALQRADASTSAPTTSSTLALAAGSSSTSTPTAGSGPTPSTSAGASTSASASSGRLSLPSRESTPTPPSSSHLPSHERPAMLRSSSSPAPAPVRTDGLVSRSARTRDNLLYPTPCSGLPLAPTPSGSGRTTPVIQPGTPQGLDLARLSVREEVQRGSPPAYESLS